MSASCFFIPVAIGRQAHMDISNLYFRPLVYCCELSNNYVAKWCSSIHISI